MRRRLRVDRVLWVAGGVGVNVEKTDQEAAGEACQDVRLEKIDDLKRGGDVVVGGGKERWT